MGRRDSAGTEIGVGGVFLLQELVSQWCAGVVLHKPAVDAAGAVIDFLEGEMDAPGTGICPEDIVGAGIGVHR